MSWEYRKLKVLGKGAFGRVYQVERNGDICAMKKIDSEDYARDGYDEAALREVDVLLRLDHPNILKCKEVKVDKSKMYVFMEQAEYDIYTWVHDMKKKQTVDDFKRYAFQILSGLEYLHRNRIIHGDIKPENVLVSPDGSIRIADFGLMLHHYPGKKMPAKYYFTIWYRSPDMLMGNDRFDESSDMWAFGCLLYIMLTGDYLFDEDYDEDMVDQIVKKLGPPPEEFRKRYRRHSKTINKRLKDTVRDLDYYNINEGIAKLMSDKDLEDTFNLIKSCLRYLPEERISAREAMSCSIFSEQENTNTTTLEVMKVPIPDNQKVKEYRIKCFKLYQTLGSKLKINSDSTLVLALNIMDRMYIARPKLNDHYLTVLTCLILAIKLNEDETNDPIRVLVKNTNQGYNREKFIKREQTIINALEFKLYYPNLFTSSIGELTTEEIIRQTIYGNVVE